MKRNDIVKGVFIVVPVIVLCVLYGLWLVVDTPVYLESLIFGALVLLLFALLYIQVMPRIFDFVMGADQEVQLTSARRSGTIGIRELLRIVLMLVIGRGVFLLGGFLWSLYLNGYTKTIFDAQHIWADHLFAGRIISIAYKGYAVEAAEASGRYYNLLYPPLYPLIVRLISPMYLSSIRAGFFVANVNAIASGVVLYLLVLHEFDRRSAVRALWYYSILPPSFLLTCTIPASTFLLLSLLCVYFARKRYFVLSSVMGALAAMTERMGIALVVLVLLEFFSAMTTEYRSLKEVTWRFFLKKSLTGATLVLVPLGFMGYLTINRMVGGSFFTYVEYLEELYDSHFALFYRVCGLMMDKFIDAFRIYDRAHAFGVYLPTLLVAVGSLGAVLAAERKMRTSYLAYFLVCYAVVFSQTGILDGPRQLFCCFPVIVALARLSKNRLFTLLLSLLCIAGSVVYLGMYVAGWPVV